MGKRMWKIPRRDVYCETLKSWCKEMVWIFLVIKLFPCAHDIASDALKGLYLEHPEEFVAQHWGSIKRANRPSLEFRVEDFFMDAKDDPIALMKKNFGCAG